MHKYMQISLCLYRMRILKFFRMLRGLFELPDGVFNSELQNYLWLRKVSNFKGDFVIQMYFHTWRILRVTVSLSL